MSEFGNETATATLKVTEKAMEAIMKLLKFLMEHSDRKLDKKIKKEKVRSLKQSEAKEYLDKSRGRVRAKKMYMSGEKLTVISASMSPEELKKFTRYAKTHNIPFSAVTDKQVLAELRKYREELNELQTIAKTEGLTAEQNNRRNFLQEKISELEKKRENRIIIVREKDLGVVSNITDEMNMDIQFEDIDKEIEAVMANEELSEEEKEEQIRELQREKNGLERDSFNKFNEKNNDIVLNDALNIKSKEEVSFEEAVCRVTNKEYIENPCYVCERTNPNNYMSVTTTEEMNDKGLPFYNTEYEVFRNGEKQECSEFSHGRFTHYAKVNGDNSTSYGDKHWENMKDEMKEKGGFSNDVILFRNKEAYEKFKEEFQKREEKIIPKNREMNHESDDYRDINSTINSLKKQVKNDFYNVSLTSDNKLIYTDTKEPIILHKEMSAEEKVALVECGNISKQISNYQHMNELQTKLAFAKQQFEINESRFESAGKPISMKPIYDEVKNKSLQEINECETGLKECLNTEETLLKERERIESVDVLNDMKTQEIEAEKLEVEQFEQMKAMEDDFENSNQNNAYVGSKSKDEWMKEVQGKQDSFQSNAMENNNTLSNNKSKDMERD